MELTLKDKNINNRKSKMSKMMEASKWDNQKFVFKEWLSIRQIYFVAYFKILGSLLCKSLESPFKFFMFRWFELC